MNLHERDRIETACIFLALGLTAGNLIGVVVESALLATGIVCAVALLILLTPTITKTRRRS